MHIDFEKTVGIPAGRLWAVLEDFGNMSWAEGIAKTELIGEGVGMTRRLHMDGMEPIDEVLESMDAANLTYSYSIPRGLPLPVSDYFATVRLEAIDQNTTRVSWACRCEPQDATIPPAELEAMIQGTYDMMLNWVAAYIEKKG